jgi:hypothetical protein
MLGLSFISVIVVGAIIIGFLVFVLRSGKNDGGDDDSGKLL